MELTAVVRGLEALKKPSHVELLTDSVYVGKGLSEWMPKWKANGWRRREGRQWKEVKNEDLWRRLDELIAEHELTYTRVAGHSGHPENDRCDELAVAAYQQFLKAIGCKAVRCTTVATHRQRDRSVHRRSTCPLAASPYNTGMSSAC